MSRSPQPPLTRRERRARARVEGTRPHSRQTRRPAKRPTWQSPIVLVTAAAVIIAVAVIVFGRPATPSTGGELITPTVVYPAGMVNGEAVGKADAPVVIQLYADFQCPICKTFITQQFGRLVADFVTPGTLRIEAKDIRVVDRGSSTESLDLAAGAACAAEQGRYWTFHDLAYWNQGPENQGFHNRDFIRRIATASELDMTAFDACYDRADVRPAITAATQAAVTAGINSTPTIVLNGQKIVGLQDYDALAAAIRSLVSTPPSAAPASTPPASTSPAASPASGSPAAS